MYEALLILLGVVIGFGIRPWYVLLTGKDIPCVREDDEANAALTGGEAVPSNDVVGGKVGP